MLHRHRLQKGARLGQSLIVEQLIGQGGMGAVYLAHDELLDRKVAVKLLLPSENDIELTALQTLLEARAAARVVHPHVVAVHGIGEHQGVPYIEMEWVDGPSLRAVQNADQLPDRATRATWIAQLAAALAHAHDAGVVHCDVKPENVLLRRDSRGGVGHVKLVDFGLARNLADGTSDRALSVATAAYLAPEAVLGPPTAAGDQFSLAMLAAELLLDQRPNRDHHAQAPQLPMPCDLPAAALAALSRGLLAQPQSRFSSTTAFADALLRGLGLAHARGPLVGGRADGQGSDASVTSTELAVPAGAMLAEEMPHDQLVLALLAVLPLGYPGALRSAIGGQLQEDLLLSLRNQNKIAGGHDDWRLLDPSERETILQSLQPRIRRMLCARAALTVEICGAKRESVREDATRLYLAARRLGDAARLAIESAEAATTARDKDLHYSRAVSMLSSPITPMPWLASLLLRVEWALQCGWLQIARGPLAEAQGVLADARLEQNHPIRAQIAIVSAELRLMSGDARGASHVLGHLLGPQQKLSESLALRAEARLLQAMSLSGRAAESVTRSKALLREIRLDASRDEAEEYHRFVAEFYAALGDVRLRMNDLIGADAAYRRALALEQERGDALATARVLVRLGDLDLQRELPTRAEAQYQQARSMIGQLGGIELLGLVQLRLGVLALRSRKPWIALENLQRARWLFDEHGIGVHTPELYKALVDATQAVGDIDGAAAHQQQLQNWHAQRRH